MKDNLYDVFSVVLIVGILLLILNTAITHKKITNLQKQIDEIHAERIEDQLSISNRFRGVSSRINDLEQEVKMLLEEE